MTKLMALHSKLWPPYYGLANIGLRTDTTRTEGVYKNTEKNGINSTEIVQCFKVPLLLEN